MTSDGKSNLADVPDHRLFARLRRLAKQRAELLMECGRIIAVLVDRGYKFREIGQRAGFPWQNGYRWYLKAMEALDQKPESKPDEPEDPDA